MHHAQLLLLFSFLCIYNLAQAQNEPRKSYLEDIFIWKMTDELKLSVPEEKKFSEIQKGLNKTKIELNKKIQTSVEELSFAHASKTPENLLNTKLNQHAIYLKKYSDLASEEFSMMRKLLGSSRVVEYLRIRNELNNKMKSVLAGESEKKLNSESVDPEKFGTLPPPKIIIEK